MVLSWVFDFLFGIALHFRYQFAEIHERNYALKQEHQLVFLGDLPFSFSIAVTLSAIVSVVIFWWESRTKGSVKLPQTWK